MGPLYSAMRVRKGLFSLGVHYSAINERNKNITQISCARGGGMKYKKKSKKNKHGMISLPQRRKTVSLSSLLKSVHNKMSAR